MTENKQFKVIETIKHDDRRIYKLTKNDIGYYNFKGEKLLAHMICNELNGLIEKNKVLRKEIERLKTQNNDLLFSNAKNMESLEKENEQLKADNNRLVNETAKVVAEHQGRVLDLIDEKIKHYQKQPLLAVRISTNCEYWKSCLHNQEINVCNKAKENAYRELKKELQEND